MRQNVRPPKLSKCYLCVLPNPKSYSTLYPLPYPTLYPPYASSSSSFLSSLRAFACSSIHPNSGLSFACSSISHLNQSVSSSSDYSSLSSKPSGSNAELSLSASLSSFMRFVAPSFRVRLLVRFDRRSVAPGAGHRSHRSRRHHLLRGFLGVNRWVIR